MNLLAALIAVTDPEDKILRAGAIAVAFAAIAAFFVGAVRLLRLMARWTVVGEEVLHHFTPDAHGQSLPGNVAQLTKSSEATAANLRVIAQSIHDTDRAVDRLGHDVGEVDRKVENLHGRVVSIERWRDRHDPSGEAAHHRRI